MNNESINSSTFLSVPDFAKKAGLGRDYVYNRVRNGSLPHLKVGNQYRVNVTAALEKLDRESKEVQQ